jgi:hypothetical protein
VIVHETETEVVDPLASPLQELHVRSRAGYGLKELDLHISVIGQGSLDAEVRMNHRDAVEHGAGDMRRLEIDQGPGTDAQ